MMSSSEESDKGRIAVRCDSTDEDDFICIIDEQVPTNKLSENDANLNDSEAQQNNSNESQSSDESDEGIVQSSSSSMDGEAQTSSTSSPCLISAFKKFNGFGKLDDYPDLQKWIHGIAVVNFDIEIGQSIETIFPGDVKLTEREVCFCFIF